MKSEGEKAEIALLQRLDAMRKVLQLNTVETDRGYKLSLDEVYLLIDGIKLLRDQSIFADKPDN